MERRNRETIRNKAREYKEEGRNVRVEYNKIIVEDEVHGYDK